MRDVPKVVELDKNVKLSSVELRVLGTLLHRFLVANDAWMDDKIIHIFMSFIF